ncbi:glutamate racemase [Methylobrevis albus]|uniref:glutamate racemase n=1 Tax=Methylobrevis albus TaxID=2793297 RepID=UPI002E2CD97D|nr:glutamate racemase [Methylobrevis albus]
MQLLVFDSGLGGLSVVAEIRRQLPSAAIAYLADTAVFPYGDLGEEALVARVAGLMEIAVPRFQPDAVVIACNTASTLVLPSLRSRFSMPIVGTVPAIKPAAEQSRSRRVSVLATPGTVARDYTRDLIRTHGGDCRFTLVGSRRLAGLAERELAGERIEDADYAAEILPCFVADRDAGEGEVRTDIVVLACTHFPLVLGRLAALAPWPVAWIDPAPAIARRVVAVTADIAARAAGQAMEGFFSTGRLPPPALAERFGFRSAAAFLPEATGDD